MVTLVLMCVSILQWFEQRLGHCYLGCQGVYWISTTLDLREAILRVSDFANFSMETHFPNSSGMGPNRPTINQFSWGAAAPQTPRIPGGLQPPRPPGGGPAAPRAPLHTERLRLSGSP